MRTVAIITARWASTRLPGKMLADINSKPMLQWVVDRCRMSKVDEVVVATTLSSQPIVDYCETHGIKYYVGDEEDIVGRLYGAAVMFKADVVIRVWGDSPLVNPECLNILMNEPAKCYNEDTYYFASNDPKGMQAALLSFAMLKKDFQTLEGEARHWYHTHRLKGNYRCTTTYGDNLSHIDLSVDDEHSLNLVRSILV